MYVPFSLCCLGKLADAVFVLWRQKELDLLATLCTWPRYCCSRKLLDSGVVLWRQHGMLDLNELVKLLKLDFSLAGLSTFFLVGESFLLFPATLIASLACNSRAVL